jgi:molecular chaperone GrpE
MTSKKSKKDKNKSQNFEMQSKNDERLDHEETEDDDGEGALGIEYPSHRELEDQLNVLEQKVNEYKDKAFRAQAMLDNVNRRAERDIEKAHRYGTEKLLVELLPVIDSLNRGLEDKTSKDQQVKNMREGIQLTLDMLMKVLKKFGVREIDPKEGEPFDPELHEAMSTMKVEGQKTHTIVRVLQKGYELNDRVVRAAMVIVAA